MRYVRFALRAIYLSTILSIAAAPALAATTYSVTQLQDPAGYSDATAWSIGPTGLAGGFYQSASRAILWDQAGAAILLPQQSAYDFVTAVNSSGQALVSVDTVYHLYSNGTYTYIDVPGANNVINAFALNDLGQVAGSAGASNFPFIWSNGVATTLASLPSGGMSQTWAINNHGQVAGSQVTASGVTHAVLWSNGAAIDLGTLPGDTSSVARNIDDAGNVVGYSTSATASRPFRWSNGVMTEISSGYDSTKLGTGGISNAGQIVGSMKIDGNWHAYSWSNGVTTDLNSFVGGTSCTGYDVNDAGQILVQCGGNYKLTPAATGMDIAVMASATPNPVTVGQPLTFSVTVANSGAFDATGVTLTDVLPAGVSLVGVTASQGSCGGTSSVACALDSLAAGASATVQLTTIPTFAGTLTNTATVTANETDVNAANNSVSTSVLAKAPVTTADLSVTMTDSPDPAKRLGNLTYAISVKNSGPASASAVTIRDALPSGMRFLSASTSQGSCSGSTTISCSLGTMASGASAAVTIVVQARSRGKFTNQVSVSTSTTESSTANNSANTTTTVK